MGSAIGGGRLDLKSRRSPARKHYEATQSILSSSATRPYRRSEVPLAAGGGSSRKPEAAEGEPCSLASGGRRPGGSNVARLCRHLRGTRWLGIYIRKPMQQRLVLVGKRASAFASSAEPSGCGLGLIVMKSHLGGMGSWLYGPEQVCS